MSIRRWHCAASERRTYRASRYAIVDGRPSVPSTASTKFRSSRTISLYGAHVAKFFTRLGVLIGVACGTVRTQGEVIERNESPRDVIGALVRQEISNQVAAAAGNDASPNSRRIS